MKSQVRVGGSFEFIQPTTSKNFTPFNQLNLGTIDVETYRDPNTNKFIPYCVVMFFKDQYFSAFKGDSYKAKFKRRSIVISDLILIVLFRLFAYMQQEGIKKFIIYAHNFSGFDSYFIINSLASMGFKTDILKIDSEIYYVRVLYNKRVVEFRCSYLLLKGSLNQCAESFGIKDRKIEFNHDWVVPQNFNYVGETPEGFSKNGFFVFKEYAIKYCLNDCVLLFKVLEVFANKIGEFDVGLDVKSYSIPGLAYKVFKRKFLTLNTIANLSLNKNVNDFIREGYYGGRTEVFMAYIGNNKGYYYDVKGMYAQAMMKDLPCGVPTRINKFTNNWFDNRLQPGFYKVHVSAPEMDIPVLPFRGEEGKLIFPFGSWVGTYYSEELLLAKEYGYSFKPIEAIVFSDSRPFLKDYVEYFTKIKEMGGAYRAIGKLFINSLYGRFAIKNHGRKTVLINSSEESYYIQRFDIVDRVEAGEFLLLTYRLEPVLSHYKSNDLFDQYFNDRVSYRKRLSYGESNVAVSAAISSLGRIHLYRDMMSVINNGGKIAYCDTDSIFAEFDYSPLGQIHGSVYWDPNNPSTTFEEGIFLSPKMYSIKGDHTHVKGVKLDAVLHEEMRKSLINKEESLKVCGVNRFIKGGYNIFLDTLNKSYTLWRNDKRIWVELEGGNSFQSIKDESNGSVPIICPHQLVTRPLKVEEIFNPFKELKLVAEDISLQEPELLEDFVNVNKKVRRFVYNQSLSYGPNITISNNNLDISIYANYEKLDYLYYTLMGKLSLETKPIYLKIIYKTISNQFYTLTKYIYSPHINFILSLPDFIKLIHTLLDKINIKYEIKGTGLLIFSLVFTNKDIKEIVNYEIIDPLPEEIQRVASLRGLKEISLMKSKLEDKIGKLECYENTLIGELGHVNVKESIEVNNLSMKLKEALKRCNILDQIIINKNEKEEIISNFIKSLIKAKTNNKITSIQNVIGSFISEFGHIKMSRDLFIYRVKTAIILLRWLRADKILKLDRVGRYSPYQIEFVNNKDEDLFITEFYNNMVFFSINDYKEVNNNTTLNILDLTPIGLNNEYLDWLNQNITLVESGAVDREKFGFSSNYKTFKGELLTVKEGLRHYEYIKRIMDERKTPSFYMYWFKDFRGRLYPKLSNFSVQSMKIIRWGFKNADPIMTTWNKEELFSNSDYREYLIRLAVKYASPNSNEIKFEEALNLIRSFEINGSFDHYEVYLRKLEIDRLLNIGEAEISPIPIDGQCNVYQHLAALTKNKELGSHVNITDKAADKDIYDWFVDLLKNKLKDAEEGPLKDYFTTIFNTNINLRKMLKQPIMTYPYGLTKFGLIRQIWRYFTAEGIRPSKKEIGYLVGLIDSVREENLKSVLEVKNFLVSVIKECRLISWVLPDGFKVYQNYYKGEEIDISTTFEKRNMETRVLYIGDKVNKRKAEQGITANFIHSLDAYHMRQIIQSLNESKIPIYTIHDSILVDLINLTKAKTIVAKEFNKMYENPNNIFKSFYIHMKTINPESKTIKNIDLQIEKFIGKGKIKANRNMFR